MTPRQQRLKKRKYKILMMLAIPSIAWLVFFAVFVLHPHLFDRFIR